MLLKYKIRFVGSDIITDYDGMNYYAAIAEKFDHPIAKDEIFVNENLSFIEKVHTIIHEIVEAEYMRVYGWDYWKAHRLADKIEEISANIIVISNALQKLLYAKAV